MCKELTLSQVYIKSREIKYEYKLDGRLFSKTFVFKNFHKIDLRQEIYSNAINYLGVISALPYFRLLPKKFVSEIIELDDYDIMFFKELFLNGLGQFFYTRRLSFTRFPIIESRSKNKPKKVEFEELDSAKAIVANGGGKDGAIAYKLLSDCGIQSNTFTGFLRKAEKTLNKGFWEQRIKFAQTLNKNSKEGYIVERFDDTRSIDDIYNNTKDFYPHLYTYAFQMLIAALHNKSKFIVVANEKSSDIGNCTWQGKEINHQYSKSFAAEKIMFQFFRKRINTEIFFFSALSPVYGVKVIKAFARYPDLLLKFNGCNREPHWCCNCSKCAFIFLVLSAYVDDYSFVSDRVFGEDLLKKASLLPTFINLMGGGDTKPLECVGEPEETWLALEELIKTREEGPVIKFYKDEIRPKIEKKLPKIKTKIFGTYSTHNFPSEIKDCLLEKLRNI